MKTLIVYYSRDGHAKKVAESIAATLKCDIEEIREPQSRRGIIGWILSGRDAWKKKILPIETTAKNPNNYDLVIIGTPIWANTMTPAIRSWLEKFSKDLKQIALFATMGGSGDKKAFAEIAEKCGKSPIASVSFLDRETNKEIHKTKLENFIKELQTR